MASVRPHTRRDGGTTYYVLYRIGSRQSSVPFNNRKSADQFKILVDSIGPERALQAWGLRDTEQAKPLGVTVAQWLEHHITHLTGVERKTVMEYKRFASRDINPTLGDIPLEALTREDISQWVNAMKEAGSSGKTIANKHGFLSAALTLAVDAKKIPANPCYGMRLPRTPKRKKVFLTRDEFNLLHGCFSEHYKPLVEFLVYSGARFSEVAALKPSDVDREHNVVSIHTAWKKTDEAWEIGAPKTDRGVRVIDMPKGVLDKLDYSRAWLFLNKAGKPVRIYGFRENVWNPTVAKAKAKGLTKTPTPHDMRHTCASWMIAAGAPLPLIQAHLGHESITTTINVYGHLDRKLAKAVAAAIFEEPK